jgi:predicted Rossmann fold nucleotide-binding protein DprA/Smf involved in DNA uptake
MTSEFRLWNVRATIVGGRVFPQLDMVKWFANELPEGIIVVSAGADGLDTAAAQAARSRGLTVLEYLPELDGLKGRHAAV